MVEKFKDLWFIKLQRDNDWSRKAEKGYNFKNLNDFRDKIGNKENNKKLLNDINKIIIGVTKIINNINIAIKNNTSLLINLKKKFKLKNEDFDKKTEQFIIKKINEVNEISKNFNLKNESSISEVAYAIDIMKTCDLWDELKWIIKNNNNIFTKVAETNSKFDTSASQRTPPNTSDTTWDGSNEELMWPNYSKSIYYNTTVTKRK